MVEEAPPPRPVAPPVSQPVAAKAPQPQPVNASPAPAPAIELEKPPTEAPAPVSLDDYFDQLDAAFSNIQPGAQSEDAQADADWPIEAAPAVEADAPDSWRPGPTRGDTGTSRTGRDACRRGTETSRCASTRVRISGVRAARFERRRHDQADDAARAHGAHCAGSAHRTSSAGDISSTGRPGTSCTGRARCTSRTCRCRTRRTQRASRTKRTCNYRTCRTRTHPSHPFRPAVSSHIRFPVRLSQ